jgi:hypothetical protein
LDRDPKYLSDISADFKPGEFPMQPWAEALTKEPKTGRARTNTLPFTAWPQGIPILDSSPAVGCPLKIIQETNLVVILYEANSQHRQIFLDGRQLPKGPNPTWLGYSVGRWERDTLVVEATGFNGKTWLDARWLAIRLRILYTSPSASGGVTSGILNCNSLSTTRKRTLSHGR